MPSRLLISALFPLLFLACSERRVAAEDRRVSPNECKSAARAAVVAARVRPRMEEDLRKKGLHWGAPVFLRAFKEEKVLELWMLPHESEAFRLFRSYPITAQSGELGPKLAEGDRQVPEGFYFVRPENMKPDSTYHLAFNIGYPNAFDLHHGRTGSLIMIHGGRASIGCLAMSDPGIEEIYSLCDAALKAGQPFFRVHVFPFRMTDLRMARADDHRWAGFWRNLRQGHDWFQTRRVPPNVTIKGGEYAFAAD